MGTRCWGDREDLGGVGGGYDQHTLCEILKELFFFIKKQVTGVLTK